jgi:hypothetical protein
MRAALSAAADAMSIAINKMSSAIKMSNAIQLARTAASRQRGIAPRRAFTMRLPIAGAKIARANFNIGAGKTAHVSRIDILTNPSVRPAFAAGRRDGQAAANASRSPLRARLPRAALSNG